LRFELPREGKADEKETRMALILGFARKWHESYRVLRHRNGFGLVDSVRYGLWLARS
jgi:hypothetical protein